MKITMNNGITFEGTQAEYEEFLAYAERKIAEDEAKEAKAIETIEFEGATYRKVEREAREGDVVVLTGDELPSWFTKGKAYKIIDGPYIGKCDGGYTNYKVYDAGYGRTRETVDVYEPIEQAKYVPQEGDIVVVTDDSASNHTLGDIGKITEVKVDTFRVTVPGKKNRGNWLMDFRFRKATSAEVEKYEQTVNGASKPKLKAGDYVKITNGTPSIIEGEIYEVLNDEENELHILDKDGDSRYFPLAKGRAKYEILSAEEAKWAKIGRKPNEFKKGDVVRVIDNMGVSVPIGSLATITHDQIDDKPKAKAVSTRNGDLRSFWLGVELITPVESLIN